MEQSGEKTEQPTARKLEDAEKRGQVAQSAEVQTVFVLLAGWIALLLTGQDTWNVMAGSVASVLGHLHDIPINATSLPGQALTGTLVALRCAGPVVLAAMVGGLLAGGIQNRFNSASEALTPDWARLDPVAGLKQVLSMRSAVPTALAAVKLVAVILLTYSTVRRVLSDPIFTSSVDVARIATFLAASISSILLRIIGALVIIAATDYAYQFWQTRQDLMMTKDEVKDEMKNQEGNPRVKAARRKRRAVSKRQMLAAVPQADVVVTNPTHIAVALRYDRQTMKAPKIVAKGIRLNAERIREIAHQHRVPIVENKPLARMMFKYGKVGGEIPAQLYAAVAEVLAWVYRVNRYRYYAEKNSVPKASPSAPV